MPSLQQILAEQLRTICSSEEFADVALRTLCQPRGITQRSTRPRKAREAAMTSNTRIKLYLKLMLPLYVPGLLPDRIELCERCYASVKGGIVGPFLLGVDWYCSMVCVVADRDE
jgi:hypothetical protein